MSTTKTMANDELLAAGEWMWRRLVVALLLLVVLLSSPSSSSSATTLSGSNICTRQEKYFNSYIILQGKLLVPLMMMMMMLDRYIYIYLVTSYTGGVFDLELIPANVLNLDNLLEDHTEIFPPPFGAFSLTQHRNKFPVDLFFFLLLRERESR